MAAQASSLLSQSMSTGRMPVCATFLMVARLEPPYPAFAGEGVRSTAAKGFSNERSAFDSLLGIRVLDHWRYQSSNLLERFHGLPWR